MVITTASVCLAVIGLILGNTSAQHDEENGRELLQFHSRRSCTYEGMVYMEGQQIAITEEPCLNCSCRQGSPVCHLRVCPKLPNPPPPGCVLVHRHRHCCPQLICRDGAAANLKGDGRSDLTLKRSGIKGDKGCMLNGTLYGEGSALHTSGLCDYCYCIRGQQHCVQPKCLLPLDGCKPGYRAHSCCPTHYNCSEAIAGEITTTSIAPTNFVGCEVEGQYYPEGEMVEAVAQSNCENCFCMKGKVQCVAVECALPLEGCIPIFTPDKCCPSSYNCSGVNELDGLDDSYLDGNTGSNYLEPLSDFRTLSSTVSNRKQSSSVRSMPASLIKYKNHHQQQVTGEGRSNEDSAKWASNTTTTVADVNITSTEVGTMSSDATTGTTGTSTQITGSDSTTTGGTTVTTDLTSISTNLPLTVTSQTTLETDNTRANEIEHRQTVETSEDNEVVATTFMTTPDEEENLPMTMQTETTFMTSMPTTMIIPEDMYIANITLHSNVTITEKEENITAVNGSLPPVRSIPPEIEAILNITHKRDDDYEYDYNEPSLPPSLPNLRIIPFVAADAVPEDHDDVDRATAYDTQDKHRPTDNPLYYKASHPNRFSPPIETEGGFLPREPILDGPFYESKYDVPYHTTGLNIPDTHIAVDITAGTIVPPSITMLPKTDDEHCLSDGREYRHGELISEPSACIMCLCYYGEVLCQETKCPHVKTGCRRLKEKEHGLCCGRVICDDGESPTVVLDRIDVTPNSLQSLQQPPPHILGGIVPPITVAEGVITPDPFRDVIRTEPAPDLPSLIGDMRPYLLERHTSTTTTTTTTTTPKPSTTTTTPKPFTTLRSTTQTKTNPTQTTTATTKPTTIKSTPETTKASTTSSVNVIAPVTPDLLEETGHEESHDVLEEKIINDNDNLDELDKQEDEDDIPGLSFDSVLQYLFSGGETTKPPPRTPYSTRRPTSTTTKTTAITSEESIKMTHNTVAVTSENSSQKNTTKPSTTFSTETVSISDRNDVLNVTSEDNAINTKYSSVPSTVFTTVSNSIEPTSSSREPPPGRPPNLDTVPMTTDSAGLGVLKLAGCNIYGRMYRVGRIISELSGPCLECMCTEVGVQCRPLDC